VLAYLADSCESEVFEQLDRPAEEEAPLRVTSQGRLRDCLDASTAREDDLGDGSSQRHPGDPLSAMVLVHEDARDSPLRRCRRVFTVLATVL